MTDPLAAAAAAGPEPSTSASSTVESAGAPTPPTSRRPKPLVTMSAVAAVVVLFDQLTKSWAIDALADGRSRHVVWTLQWNLSFNKGMAFSTGQGMGPVIGLAALAVVVLIALSVRRTTSRLVAVAAGLIGGGAIGNLVDRVCRGEGWLHGRVIDFIDFQWFPIFNVADIGVNIGGALFVLWSIFSRGDHHANGSAE